MAQPFLKIITGPDTGKSFTLEKTTVKIGRAQSNDIYIDDKAISGHHSTITFKNNKITIKDHSKNGTFVNGNKINETTINFGDEIRVGRSKMRLFSGAEDETLLLETSATVQESEEETVMREDVVIEQKPAKKKIRPIMWVVPIVIIMIIVVIVFGRKGNPPPPPPPPPPPVRNTVNIEEAWKELNANAITNIRIQTELNKGYDEWKLRSLIHPALYNAINIWKQVIDSVDYERKKILENIIKTADFELRTIVQDEISSAKLLLDRGEIENAFSILKVADERILDENDPDKIRIRTLMSDNWEKFSKIKKK